MPDKKLSTISVCVIVKNEEKAIGGFMRTIKDIADELILVDTGSSDGTLEIAGRLAEQYKISTAIFHYKYTGAFHYPKAKNFSISKATSDYIFVLDADERLSIGFINRIKQYLNREKPRIARIKRVDELVRHIVDHPIRIIKNKENIFYDELEEERVHEKMTTDELIGSFEPTIWHCQRENHWLQNPPRMLSQLQLGANAEKRSASFLWHCLRGVKGFVIKFRKLYFHRKLYKDGAAGFKFAILKSLESLWAQFLIGLTPRPGNKYWDHPEGLESTEDAFDY
jgi:glycosyltransferase involved in cell wall biosynthesis